MNNKEKFDQLTYSGEIYDCNDRSMLLYQTRAKSLIDKYNRTPNSIIGYLIRKKLVKKIFKKCDSSTYVEPPFHANFGGKNVSIGKNFYSNFNLTLVDDSEIIIGDYVMIGPNVTIITAIHPVSPRLRDYGLQYNKKVFIEDHVWIGANVTVLPGVTIGKNSIIGASSVVTKDVEPNAIYVGNPARKLRNITDDDYIYYDHGKQINKDILDKYK